MQLVIERAGDGVIPGELFGQTGQFIGAAPPEQGTHTWLSQLKVSDRSS